MQFYYGPGSIALASHIALEEAGAEYQAVRVDFQQGQQKAAEYLKINPKARVPSIVTPAGVLTETPAILTWIATSWPEANLAPPIDSFTFAEMQSALSYFASWVHVAHAHIARGYRWTDDEAAQQAMREYGPSVLADAFRTVEQSILKTPWIIGEQFTVADAHLYAITRWIEKDGLTRSDFPRLADHAIAMEQRPAVQRALAHHQ